MELLELKQGCGICSSSDAPHGRPRESKLHPYISKVDKEVEVSGPGEHCVSLYCLQKMFARLRIQTASTNAATAVRLLCPFYSNCTIAQEKGHWQLSTFPGKPAVAPGCKPTSKLLTTAPASLQVLIDIARLDELACWLKSTACFFLAISVLGVALLELKMRKTRHGAQVE